MTVRRHGNTESVDNYLKAILFLEGGAEKRRVSSKALAERLGVAPASVTNMLQKLAGAAAPLVEYERHRGVSLSAGGTEAGAGGAAASPADRDVSVRDSGLPD